jgi:hypothetical protein
LAGLGGVAVLGGAGLAFMSIPFLENVKNTTKDSSGEKILRPILVVNSAAGLPLKKYYWE